MVNNEFVKSTDPIVEVLTRQTEAPHSHLFLSQLHEAQVVSASSPCFLTSMSCSGTWRALFASPWAVQGITWGLTDVSSGSSMITMREELVKTGWDKSYSWCTFPWEKFDALQRTCTQLLCPCRKSCHCISMSWENCSSLGDKILPVKSVLFLSWNCCTGRVQVLCESLSREHSPWG